ncbi:DUF7563 family protein [Salinigranum halophilum]
MLSPLVFTAVVTAVRRSAYPKRGGVGVTPLSVGTPENECLHCGAHVTSRFCRVFGDEQRRAHRCTECDTHIRISKGSAAGL